MSDGYAWTDEYWASDYAQATDRREAFKRALLTTPYATAPKVRVCLHPTWTFSGDGQRTYLKCSTCPAVMPICHECGQGTMPETSEEDW